MKWKTKWVLAIILVSSVVGVSRLEERGVIQQPVTQYISSGKDFIVMKKWVSSLLKEPENPSIAVSGELSTTNQFSNYESIQPYEDGVIISYTQPMAITALESGLITFTGYTRQSGKTVTVLYNDGDEVTYGFVGEFSKLPYTAVKKGDTLALMDEDAIYLMVKRDGVKMDASLLPTYLSGPDQ